MAVEQAHRRRGIATRLVEETARCWRENPAAVKSLRVVYSSAAQTFEAIVRTLDAAGFSPPTPRVYILAGAPERLARARFMRMFSLWPPFELIGWGEATDEDRLYLERTGKGQWIPEDLYPFGREVHMATSVGVRCQGDLIGWVLTHDLGGGLFRWTNAYIHPDHKARCRILPAYAESLKRGLKHGMKRVIAGIPVYYEDNYLFWKHFGGQCLDYAAMTYGRVKELQRCGDERDSARFRERDE